MWWGHRWGWQQQAHTCTHTWRHMYTCTHVHSHICTHRRVHTQHSTPEPPGEAQAQGSSGGCPKLHWESEIRDPDRGSDSVRKAVRLYTGKPDGTWVFPAPHVLKPWPSTSFPLSLKTVNPQAASQGGARTQSRVSGGMLASTWAMGQGPGECVLLELWNCTGLVRVYGWKGPREGGRPM